MEVVCLFEESGFSAEAWAEAGHDVFCYDILNENREEPHGGGRKIWRNWDALDEDSVNAIIGRHFGSAVIVLGFPPCTDLAVSGAAWFSSKLKKDPDYRKKAMSLVLTVRDIGRALGVPWCIENPVSVISSEWRKPDHRFHPHEFGGYLPVDDEHPMFPKYIAPRDAYTKKTCYWTGGGFVFPDKKPVPCEPSVGGRSRQDRMLGGKSARTKQIRSMSPRGVALGIYKSNRAGSVL